VQNLVQPSEIGASALIDTRQLDQTALIQQIATDPGFAELAPGPLVALRRLAVRGRAAHR